MKPERILNLKKKIKKAGINPNSVTGVEWLRKTITKNINKVKHQRFIDGYKNVDNLQQGKMYLFRYDPKYKDKLPVWDEYPLIFVLEVYNNGFLGLNLHYVPPRVREIILLQFVGSAEFNKHKAKQINYTISKTIMNDKYLKNMIKRYLSDHLRSQVSVIPEEDWAYVIFIPLAKFHKQSKHKVWKGM